MNGRSDKVIADLAFAVDLHCREMLSGAGTLPKQVLQRWQTGELMCLVSC